MARIKSKLFHRIRRGPCPACLDRDALSLLGRPAFDRLGRKLTFGCEVCGGSGAVDLGHTRMDSEYDPWTIRLEADAA